MRVGASQGVGSARCEVGTEPSVVDFVRGKPEWAWMDSMKSETVARAVLGMRGYTQVRASVWDGVRSHRSELVKSAVGVKTIVQPVYNPELNPDERVFEEVRRWVEGRSVRKSSGEDGCCVCVSEQAGV